MTERGVVLSPVVRARAERLGAGGVRWLADLPGLIADLERRWSVTVGEPLGGGTAAYVARARTADGTDVVLKLAVPDPDFAAQVRTLRAAGGRGYVALLGNDLERHAVLLEALGPSLDRLGLTPEAQIATLCGMLRLAWKVPPERGSPAAAVAYSERRAAAFDPERCVTVHGDPAPPNALLVPPSTVQESPGRGSGGGLRVRRPGRVPR